MEVMIERLDEMEEDLLARDYLYDAPRVYREGVEAAVEAVRATLARINDAA